MALALCMALLPATALAGSTEVVPCKYDNTGYFSDGLAIVELNGKYGFIDKTGKEVIPCKYDNVGYCFEGLAAVVVNGKCGFVDKTGKEVIPCKYDVVGGFSEGLSFVGVAATDADGYTSYRYGYIDKTGDTVIPIQYYEVNNFSDGLALVRGDANPCFIDKTGKVVITSDKYNFYRYSDGKASSFSEGLAPVQGMDSLKWGFIDKTGKEVIPCQFESAGSFVSGFSEGLAPVTENGLYGFIDKTGKLVTPCKYTEVGLLSGGMAPVSVGQYPNEKWGFIDETGKEILPCQYTYEYTPFGPTWTPPYGEGFAAIYEKGKWGYMDKAGNTVVAPQYDDVGSVHDGFASFELNGKRGFISIDGSGAAPSKPAEPTVGDFNDVLASAYYADAVKWAVDKGVTNGTSDTTFSPDEVCTRAQAMTCLWRANGSPEPKAASNPFTDIAESDYYYKPVLWAIENGITNGVSDTAFGPDAKCTRAQYMTFLYRAVGGQGSGSSASFSDVAADAYYADAVSWAVNNSVTNGTGASTFSPDDSCVRGAMVTFLYRVFAK